MSWLTIIISLVALSVLEAASHNYIKLLGVSPELLLLGVLYFSLNSGIKKAAACGLLGGILKMIFSGMHPLVIIIYASVGFAAAFFKEALYKQLPSAQMILSFIAVVVYTFIYSFLISSLALPFYKSVFTLSIPSALYTSVLAPFIFFMLDLLLPTREVEYREIIFKKRVFEGRRPQ